MSVAALGSGAAGQDAEWIWVPGQAASGQRAHLVRLFEVAGEVARARLVATCDNHMMVYVNGEEVARSDMWESPVAADVASALRPGRNVVAVEGWNDGGPAGMALRLDITYADGEKQRVVSSGAWRAAETAPEGWERPGFQIRNWGRAVSLGSTADESLPWGGVMTQREATPAGAIRLPEGFRAELVHSAQAGEGSWVCLVLDGDGRAIVSPESGGLLRLTRTGPEAAEVERLGADIGMCQGLLFAHGALYASVNENEDRQGGLHRLRDRDGDGQFEEHEVLAEYPAKGEHGPHGLALGPDGMIYAVHGNHTPLFECVDREGSPYRNWGEDLLLPRIWDPRGHAVGIMAPGGTVLRTDPDGERWEIVAAGLRNSYDIAFAPNGELFTYDSDMEWDIGTPWYRPPRVVHVVEGGEYGWRSGSGKWPDWYPDSLPPVVDTDLASPVGVAFASGGMFPEPWASALYVGDWAYGRIAAVHLEPAGASYSGQYETFALGLPLSVTDIEFASDGAMWFTTGGRGTQSGLYRVTYEGADAAGAHKLTGLPEEAQLRRRLEGFEGGPLPEEALAALGHGDRFVRFAARLALERSEGMLDAMLLAESAGGWTGVETGLAFVRSKVEEPSADTNANMVMRLLGRSRDPAQIIAAVRSLELAAIRGGEVGDSVRAGLLSTFDGVYPSDDARMNRVLGELLVHLRAPAIAPRLLRVIEQGPTREDQLHAALCLRLVAEQLAEAEQDRYFTWLRSARRWPGGMSFAGFIDAIEREALEKLDDGSRARVEQRLAAMSEADAVKPAPARPFVQQWTVEGALQAVEGVGGQRSLARGAAMFSAARCVECHRFGSAGGATGPDLTGVARRFSRRDLLEAIVEPSKVVSDQYRASIVRLDDGRELTGRLLQITGGRMDVLTDPFSHTVVSVNPGAIESVEESEVSPMLPGLLDTLTAAEIADLLAYLESGAK